MKNFTKFAAAVFFCISFLIAQVPQLINYQGYLGDHDGNPLSGVQTIEFSIYDEAEEGILLWHETQTIAVDEGLFNVLLGSATPIPTGLFDEEKRFLTIKVGSDESMSPATQITSVAYAFQALNADSLNGNSSDDFVKTGQTDIITKEMLEDSFISSLNNIENDGGNINLVAGSNISIAADDVNDQITISATGGGDGEADNLGNHTATQNLQMNGHWINHDGGSMEGIFIDTDGNVGIGTHTPSEELTLWGTLKSMTSEDGNVNAVEGIAYDDGEYENRGGKFLAYGQQGIGVMGVGVSTDNVKNYGGYFVANGDSGIGAYASGQGDEATGVVGKSTGQNGVGVKAEANGADAKAISATTSGESGVAVYGLASYNDEGSSEKNYGGYFQSDGKNGIAAYGEATGPYGIGIHSKVTGEHAKAIRAESAGDNGTGVSVNAEGTYSRGIDSYTDGRHATTIKATANGNEAKAIHAISRDWGYGLGPNYAGVFEAVGDSARAIQAYVNTNSANIIGLQVAVQYARKAAEFWGNVDVYGMLHKSAGGFKIDHPKDPENKYLQHSFVESPDMLNVYNGTVALDGNGGAIVKLPDYFDALNVDFQYQLTPIGAPMPNLYIAQKIENNEFRIGGGEPQKEVSWQVTGIRNDSYAKENRIQVEVYKNQKENGTYKENYEKNINRIIR